MEQNDMEILLEEMCSKFDLVLWGHAALHARIEDVRNEVREMKDLMDFKFEVVGGDIRELKSDVAVLKHDVADLKHNLAEHRADTGAHPRYIVRE